MCQFVEFPILSAFIFFVWFVCDCHGSVVEKYPFSQSCSVQQLGPAQPPAGRSARISSQPKLRGEQNWHRNAELKQFGILFMVCFQYELLSHDGIKYYCSSCGQEMFS